MLAALLLGTALSPVAFAQDEPPEDEPTEPSEPTQTTGALPETMPTPAATTPKKRLYLMEVNFRGRYMFLPDSILDIWYFQHEGEGFERPNIAAYTLGVEFVVKDKSANGIFYVEYINPLFKEGYFDDVEEPPDYDDGSYIVPDKFGLVAIGANYAYSIRANDWFEFLIGAGLGVGIKLGNLTEWQPGEPEGTTDGNNVDADCGTTSPAYERRASLEDGGAGCGDDGTVQIPGAIPFVDVNLGPRFNFSDRGSLRIEVGLHNLPYVGMSGGITF